MHDFTVTRRKYDRLVAGVARFRTRDGRLETEDLIQDIWLTIWSEWDTLKHVPNPVGLLRRRAHQIATEQWRALIRTKRAGDIVEFDEDYHSPVIPAPQPSAVLLDQVMRDIELLPDKQRRAMQATAAGCSLAETGRPDGVTHQAIHLRLEKARTTLHSMGH